MGFLIPALSLAGLALAWLNVRAGRGDKRGALRLAVFILAASMADWLLSVDHAPGPAEIVLFRMGVGVALFQAASAYFIYLALEPHVRRRWPQVLIAWSRALSGQLRDPLVGREVLVGIALAAVWYVVWATGFSWTSRVSDADLPWSPALSLGQGAALFIGFASSATFLAVVTCFFILVLRVVFRSVILAAAVFAAVFAIGAAGTVGGSTLVALTAVTLGLLGTVALTRFGLVALTAFFTAQSLTGLLRIGLVWRGAAGALPLMVLVVVASYACYLAIGSPRLLPRKAKG